MAKRPQSKRRSLKVAVPKRVFLAASVPLPSRDAAYFDTADVIAIRDAIRALTIVILEKNAQLVFGGHPAISPMIRLQIAQAGISVRDKVVMYQSRFFDRDFPVDNAAFERVILIDKVDNERDKSLARMRDEMLSGEFSCGVFVGGMEGVEDEYNLFTHLHTKVPAFPIASTGAAALRIFNSDASIQKNFPQLQEEISYIGLMRSLIPG
jgi:hypothetical protein